MRGNASGSDDPSANRARRRGRPVSVVVPGGKAVM
jgi:hypothetical protein